MERISHLELVGKLKSGFLFLPKASRGLDGELKTKLFTGIYFLDLEREFTVI